MEALPVEIRYADDRDTKFVTSSWLKSFRGEGKFSLGIPNTVYFHNHHKILEALLPRCAVLVACNAEDPDHILGWVCAEVMDGCLVIHYTYVKRDFRGYKIAKRMWEALLRDTKAGTVIVTHQTKSSRSIERARTDRGDLDPTIVYNPYILFMSLPDGWQK